jgi:hypothetical protein
MRDDELLGGETPPRRDDDVEGGGCFGVMWGCLIMLVLVGIVALLWWLL